MTLPRRKLIQADIERMRIPERYWDSKYSTIQGSVPGDGTLQGKIQIYLKNLPDMMETGVGLMLWGDNSRGKTSAAVVALLEARRRGYTGLFLHAAQLKDKCWSDEPFDEEESWYDRILSVDFLLIDDLGKGVQDSTGAGERLLATVVRTRCAAKKVTWITMNMKPDELVPDFCTKSTVAAFLEAVLPIEVQGPDMRAPIAQKILSRFTPEQF